MDQSRASWASKPAALTRRPNIVMIVLDDMGYIMANGEKLILASRHLVPRTAVCDPELTVGLPPRLLPEHCCHVGVGRVEANGDGFANRGSPTARAVVIATVPMPLVSCVTNRLN